MTPRRLIEPARLAGTPLLRTQSDARLVDLVRAGHAAAFDAIVHRYRRPLLKYCARMLPSSRTEDAVQQTFLNAYQAMVSGDAELNLRPWLYRIARNSSLNLLRENGWSHEQLDERMDGVLRPEQLLETRERLRSTVRAVKELPDRQRDAVLMRELEGLSYEEIADALGVGDGAVRQLLHRARARLREGASAVTPFGLLERLAGALGSGGDPSARVAELTAGAGVGAGVLKIGAAVLASGAIATGAIGVSQQSTHRSSRAAHAGVAAAPTQRPHSHGRLVLTDDLVQKHSRGALARGGASTPAGTAPVRHDNSVSSGGDDGGGRRTSGGSGRSGGRDDGGRSGSSSGSDDHSGSGQHSGSNVSGGGTSASDDSSGPSVSGNSGPGGGGTTDVSGGSGSNDGQSSSTTTTTTTTTTTSDGPNSFSGPSSSDGSGSSGSSDGGH